MNLFIRVKIVDPNTDLYVNVDKIDYYHSIDNEFDCSTIMSVNGHEFKCKSSVDEIKERIMLAEIADNLA